MERLEKQKQIEFLKDIFNSSKSIILASVESLNAAEIAALRKKLQNSSVGFKVVKNSLARIASNSTPVSILIDDFKNSTAIAWSTIDEISPARALVEYQESLEKFKIKSGYSVGQKFDFIKIKELAKLPNLAELRAQLLGVMQAVSGKLLSQISAPAAELVGVIRANNTKTRSEEWQQISNN